MPRSTRARVPISHEGLGAAIVVSTWRRAVGTCLAPDWGLAPRCAAGIGCVAISCVQPDLVQRGPVSSTRRGGRDIGDTGSPRLVFAGILERCSTIRPLW